MAKSDLSLFSAGGQMYNWQVDDNFKRLFYYSGQWLAGTYEANEAVLHNSAFWVCLADTTDEPSINSANWEILSQSVTPGYSGVNVSSDKNYGTVSATYQPLDLWDANTFPDVNSTMNLDGTFTMDVPGWWSFYVQLSASHNESQGSRTLNFRLFNVTDSIPADGVEMGVGRNVSVSNVMINPWFQVTDTSKTFRLEFAVVEGQDFTDYTVTTASMRLKLEA